MPQPVYVVSRTDVLALIDKLAVQPISVSYPVTSLAWGSVQDVRNLIDAVNTLKRYPDDTINLSALAQCLQKFHTSKMIGHANRMLVTLWTLIKSKRKVLALTPKSDSIKYPNE
jgi:hypothetical protein